MALHPDFLNSADSYIYFVHSYNAGTSAVPNTNFKIRRIKWNAGTNSIVNDTTLVSALESGYDHLGGRLLIVSQNNTPYLFFSMGDHGISETNSPTCYTNQASNPNTLAQDPAYPNGKIHRFNLNGSVPASNPIPGNSFYTRGHRNPQGLMYNPNANIIYDVEHGDRTDDEINVLKAGMNYGWKYVRGYMNDNNYPGEANFVNTYTPHPQLSNDALQGPLFAWCATAQPTIANNGDWCTVAPSDGIYYGSTGIPGWMNSLLIVTLKDGSNTDMQLFRFKLNADGVSLAPPAVNESNPTTFFAEDQAQNGRLRDIAVSPDGKQLFLINNGGANRDKITIYTFDPKSSIPVNTPLDFSFTAYPNPFTSSLQLSCSEEIQQVKIYNFTGTLVANFYPKATTYQVDDLRGGVYYLIASTKENGDVGKLIICH